MVKAIISLGQVQPLEPVPADWHEGQSLRIIRSEQDDASTEAIDRDFTILEELCSTNDSKNEHMLDQALQQAKRQAKEQVSQQMGLS